jgi:hypothetical protein
LDSAQIEESLIDGYDDITKGLINYQVYDSSCTTILNTVLKYNANTATLDEPNIDFSLINPVGSILIFVSDTPIFNIELIDLCGKKFFFTAVNENQFDVSKLTSGYYFIRTLNNQLTNKSFIKL